MFCNFSSMVVKLMCVLWNNSMSYTCVICVVGFFFFLGSITLVFQLKIGFKKITGFIAS